MSRVPRGVSVVAIALCACDPPPEHSVVLTPLSAAPFASVASIVDEDVDDPYVVELSLGVALAATCWSTCYPDEVCKLTATEPERLGIRPLYHLAASAREDYVLVAQTTGVTSLRVESACASRTYLVRILGR